MCVARRNRQGKYVVNGSVIVDDAQAQTTTGNSMAATGNSMAAGAGMVVVDDVISSCGGDSCSYDSDVMIPPQVGKLFPVLLRFWSPGPN